VKKWRGFKHRLYILGEQKKTTTLISTKMISSQFWSSKICGGLERFKDKRGGFLNHT